MARLSHNPDEIFLKCDDCDILFRHAESDLVKTRQAPNVVTEMWDSPCCHRRYSLLEATNPNDVCAVITHGYRDRKSRDKYQVLNSGGIDWDWASG